METEMSLAKVQNNPSLGIEESTPLLTIILFFNSL